MADTNQHVPLVSGNINGNNIKQNESTSESSSRKRSFLSRQQSIREKLTPEQKWRSLAIIFIILDILLLLITMTVVCVWVKERQNKPNAPQSSTFCLSKQDISLHKDDDDENFKLFERKIENEKEVYCTESGKYLDSLVHLYVERNYRIERAKEPYYSYCNGYTDTSKKPAARVVGVEHAAPVDDQTRTHLVHWDGASDQSFVNNVTYSGGRFAINQKGYYYIYSQVTFKEEQNSTDTPYTSLCHFIFRIKPNGNKEYTEKLLESSQSKCRLQSQTSNSTSYIGAVFYLAEQDKVQVKVTHPEKITRSPFSNYFGLHMI